MMTEIREGPYPGQRMELETGVGVEAMESGGLVHGGRREREIKTVEALLESHALREKEWFAFFRV